MKHIYKLTSLAIAAALVLSGCAETKTPADSEKTTETTASVTTTGTEETTTTTTSEAETTKAVTAETAVTEETTTETTVIATTTTGETTLQTTTEETTSKITADNSTSTDTPEPPPEIDKDMFTLYLGGNTTSEKYDVSIDSLPADIVDELVKTLPKTAAILTADKNGKYTFSDGTNLMLPESVVLEHMFSRDYYESILPTFAYTEYENMTYEEFREYMLESLDEMYPGLKGMFDSDGNLNIKTEYCEIISVSYKRSGGSSDIFAEETVIKEGIRAVFDSLALDKSYKDLVSDAKKNNKSINTVVEIYYFGSYELDYSCETSYSAAGKSSKIEGSAYLGKAKIYETAPDTTTHYVIPADSSLFEWINTDDNPYEMSLDIVADGYCGDTIYIDESGYSNVMSNDAILGVIPEIEIGEFGTKQNEKLKQVWVKFKIKEPYRYNVLGTFAEKEPELNGIKRLNFFMFADDINMTIPIETYFDEQNYTAYTVTDMGGTYCLYDMEMWLDMLGIEP